jgi:hypothetical protein
MKYAGHLVQFFATDAHLIEAVGRYTYEGLRDGYTCIVVATATHRRGIDAFLAGAGMDPVACSSQYRYIALDARATLATISSSGQIDRPRFHQNMNLLLRQAGASGLPLRFFGEMVGLLATQGRLDLATELEELWNELSRQFAFEMMCGYPLSALSGNPKAHQQLCAVHSGVLPTPA